MPDLVPGHEVAQAWGYVVAGYFLVEESFKALLYLRGKKVPTKHSLTMLFNLFEPDDKEILREYYTDYHETGGWPKKFPIEILDEFLVTSTATRNKRGDDHIGSFDWRYFLIEEQRSAINADGQRRIFARNRLRLHTHGRTRAQWQIRAI